MEYLGCVFLFGVLFMLKVVEWLVVLDFFILLSWVEGIFNVLFEVFVCGWCVVVIDVGGILDVVMLFYFGMLILVYDVFVLVWVFVEVVCVFYDLLLLMVVVFYSWFESGVCLCDVFEVVVVEWCEWSW